MPNCSKGIPPPSYFVQLLQDTLNMVDPSNLRTPYCEKTYRRVQEQQRAAERQREQEREAERRRQREQREASRR